LPNGQWTETPTERLRHLRELKVSYDAKLSTSAQFILRISPEKVESVHFEYGDESLKPIAQQLTSAHYPVEFPPGSAAVLSIRLNVDCHRTGPCTVALQKPTPQTGSPIQPF
jgi:hypothetical protein